MGDELTRKQMMNKKAYTAVMNLSFGEVSTELKPDSGIMDQHQALNAMLETAHHSLTSWVADFTLDPESDGGRQERITLSLKDGNREIGEMIFSVPTTSTFDKVMFERLVQQTIAPEVLKAFRSFPSTMASQAASTASDEHLLTQEILPDAIRHASQVSPRQLQTAR